MEEVLFFVGKDRRIMIGKVEELKTVSPVFAAMLDGTWKDRKEGVDIPDVTAQAFGLILRFASQEDSLQLKDSTVWDVLQAADKYNVLVLVSKCFHYLLHKHKAHDSCRHICTVVEVAHQRGCSQHHTECMEILIRRADKVFKREAGLAELCQDCMQSLITSTRLPNIPETQVYEAVVTWARCACRKRGVVNPDCPDMRACAEKLLPHVRYLTIPHHDLLQLLGVPHVCHTFRSSRLLPGATIPSLWRHVPGPPLPCLLTQDEADDLLHNGGQQFPDSVKLPRLQLPSTN